MTPKKPTNPFAAITDAPLPPPTPDRQEERHREHMRWEASTNGILHTLKWLLVALVRFNITTCVHTCSVDDSVRHMRVY